MVFDLVLDGADGAGISWLHRNAEVLAKAVRDDGRVAMSVRVDPAKVSHRARRNSAPEDSARVAGRTG